MTRQPHVVAVIGAGPVGLGQQGVGPVPVPGLKETLGGVRGEQRTEAALDP